MKKYRVKIIVSLIIIIAAIIIITLANKNISLKDEIEFDEGTIAEMAEENAKLQKQVDNQAIELTEVSETEEAQNLETMAQRNAVKAAIGYLNSSHFSRDELIEQLEFEKYTTADATYAVDKVYK